MRSGRVLRHTPPLRSIIIYRARSSFRWRYSLGRGAAWDRAAVPSTQSLVLKPIARSTHQPADPCKTPMPPRPANTTTVVHHIVSASNPDSFKTAPTIASRSSTKPVANRMILPFVPILQCKVMPPNRICDKCAFPIVSTSSSPKRTGIHDGHIGEAIL